MLVCCWALLLGLTINRTLNSLTGSVCLNSARESCLSGLKDYTTDPALQFFARPLSHLALMVHFVDTVDFWVSFSPRCIWQTGKSILSNTDALSQRRTELPNSSVSIWRVGRVKVMNLETEAVAYRSQSSSFNLCLTSLINQARMFRTRGRHFLFAS